MATLPWSTAARIARRELRASRGKFLFVVLSVAIGVAALTGVRGFSSAFKTTLLLRARSILAADISARMFQQPTPAQMHEMESLKSKGTAMTAVTEMSGMATAGSATDPLLVSLKAVDPAQYPFYGTVSLAPQMPLSQALSDRNVAVGEDLLIRLHAKLGDSFQLGDATLRVAAVVTSEPDRLSGSFAAGPRVLLTQQELAATHLLEPGSRAGQRFLFKLPVRNDAAVASLKEKLEALIPEAQITDYRETSPAITSALGQSTSMLSLVSLVALVLGAVGVAMAMRTHLVERMDSIAIMKSLGARSSHVLRIYFLETLYLGLLGGIAGVVLGAGVQLLLPLMLAKLLGMAPDLRIAPGATIAGLLTAVATTALFTLPPLLDIRRVRPGAILRRGMEDAVNGGTVARAAAWMRRSGAQIGAGVLIALGIALLATKLSDSPRVGSVFTVALGGVLLVLMIAAALLLAGLRMLLRSTRFALPSTVRHGLANLYRPGNPSAALLAAVGLGVMQIATVFFLGHAFVQALHVATQPTLPNVFLIDVSPDEVEGVRTLLTRQPEVRGEPEMLPIVSSRIISVDGVPASDLRLKNFPKRMLRTVALTWTESLPPGDKVVAGQFWTAGEHRPQVAIGREHAERLHVHVGSHIVFAAAGDPDHPIDAVVSSLVHSDGQHAWSRVEFLLPKAALDGLPTVWYGGVHAAPDRVGELQRALFAKYPTVTVINVAQAMETLRNVLLQVSLAVQFLAGFSIFAGLVILASAIAGTRYRRIREVVVLKTLGGTRSRIAGIFSVEFATLGLVAGVVGLVAANLVTRVLLRRMDLEGHFLPMWNIVALATVMLLTVATGWLASWRVLGQKPLEVLREE